MKKYWSVLVLLFAQWMPANADMSCQGQTSKVLSNICIECFFPLRMAIQIGGGGSGSLPDDKAAPICICPAPFPIFFRIGFVGGGWLPEGILEATPTAYCSSTLGGISLGSEPGKDGTAGWSAGGGSMTHWNVHYYKFPLGQIASMLSGFACAIPMGSDFSAPAMLSELDPTWNDPQLAALKNPEGLPPDVGMPLLQAACAAEYATMQANSGFYGSHWCTGGSGPTYPLSGMITNSGNPAYMAAHASSRLLDGMYRLGLQRKTWGSQAQICHGQGEYRHATPKNGHRLQQVAPERESGNHRIGDDWNGGVASGVPVPPGLRVQGSEINNMNHIFINWKYYECCVL